MMWSLSSIFASAPLLYPVGGTVPLYHLLKYSPASSRSHKYDVPESNAVWIGLHTSSDSQDSRQLAGGGDTTISVYGSGVGDAVGDGELPPRGGAGEHPPDQVDVHQDVVKGPEEGRIGRRLLGESGGEG